MSKAIGFLMCVLAATQIGCKSRLLFGTQSSIGLDISGMSQIPNKVSLSYSRHEFAYVPRKADGSSHSVYGGLDSDMKFSIPPQYIIKQTFATGDAAANAASNIANDEDELSSAEESGAGESANRDAEKKGDDKGKGSKNSFGSDHPLSFYTGTKFGIHLSLGEGQMAANALIGYRRTEATVIPIPDDSQEVRPIYADIEINNTTRSLSNRIDQPSGSTLGGVRIKQGFATGNAAVILSSRKDVKEKLSEASGAEVQAYREGHANQEKSSLQAIAEYSLGSAEKKEKIRERARELEIVPADTTEQNFLRRLRASPDAANESRGIKLKLLSDYAKSLR